MGLVCCLQLLSWYFSSESPRWLMSQHRQDQFLSLIFKASKQNGKLVKTSTLLALQTQDEADSGEEEESSARPQFSSLFQRPQVVLTASLLVLWPVTAIGYYGISLSMSSLGDNAFLNNALAALIEIPSYIFLVLVVDRLGRKPVLIFCQVCLTTFKFNSDSLEGAKCILNAFI